MTNLDFDFVSIVQQTRDGCLKTTSIVDSETMIISHIKCKYNRTNTNVK